MVIKQQNGLIQTFSNSPFCDVISLKNIYIFKYIYIFFLKKGIDVAEREKPEIWSYGASFPRFIVLYLQIPGQSDLCLQYDERIMYSVRTAFNCFSVHRTLKSVQEIWHFLQRK